MNDELVCNEADAPVDHDPLAQGVLVVRRGPGANCSSIGSAVEMLFLSATVGAAVLAAVVAALRSDASVETKPVPPTRDDQDPGTSA